MAKTLYPCHRLVVSAPQDTPLLAGTLITADAAVDELAPETLDDVFGLDSPPSPAILRLVARHSRRRKSERSAA